MAENFYTILTNTGKAKIANAQALGTTVDLTQMAAGDGNGAYYNPTETQTALVNQVWSGALSSIDVDTENPNWIVVEAVIPTADGGFMVREVGLFDDDGDMIAVGKYPETYKPLLGEGSAKDLYVRMIIEVTNASVVTLKIDPAVVLATKKNVDDAKANLAGEGRTTETVKANADALAAHLAETAKGVSAFAGCGDEVTIPHGLPAAPVAAYAFPTSDPEGYLGEVWIRINATNIYVGNSGSYSGPMCWVAIG